MQIYFWRGVLLWTRWLSWPVSTYVNFKIHTLMSMEHLLRTLSFTGLVCTWKKNRWGPFPNNLYYTSHIKQIRIWNSFPPAAADIFSLANSLNILFPFRYTFLRALYAQLHRYCLLTLQSSQFLLMLPNFPFWTTTFSIASWPWWL